MTRFALTALLLAATSPALAQDAAPPAEEKIRQVIVYGQDACPQGEDGEIVVCARLNENERYRIPPEVRDDPRDPANQSWAQRVQAYETVGASGVNSCSPVGGGGFTGCTTQLIDAAYAEKREAPGLTWNRRIEAARQLRLEGIDADSEAIEARVRQIEANQAAQAAANQGGDPMQEPVPAAPPPGSNETP